MVHHRNSIILAAVVFTLIAFIPSPQAEPPAKPGNPGLPGCLAKVHQLEQIITHQNLTILRLQKQINTLQASLDGKDQIIAEQELTIGALQEQIDTLQASLDAYKNYAPVARTGQTYIEREGLRDDGDLRRGVEWPVPRFTDNNDGTVTDNLTRLVWLKNADCLGLGNWYQALIFSNELEATNSNCGLNDGSAIGDWRLPNRNELLSLVDINYENPYDPNFHWHGALPQGHPFIIRPSTNYWTSSTSSYNFGATAWVIFMSSDGALSQDGKSNTPNGVWPVRDSK